MGKSRELPILLKVVEEKYLQSALSGNIFLGSLNQRCRKSIRRQNHRRCEGG